MPRAGGSPLSSRSFQQIQLEVEFVNFRQLDRCAVGGAIATSKADAGVGMALRWLKALEQGFDVKLTAKRNAPAAVWNLLTAKNSPFGSLESLKGQTVASPYGRTGQNFFAILLKRHGIDPIKRRAVESLPSGSAHYRAG